MCFEGRRLSGRLSDGCRPGGNPASGKEPRIREGVHRMAAEFCTCRDKACPLNPVNHDKGCTPCVAKCLREGELPSCFFNAVTPYRGPNADYSYEGFARVVLGRETAPAERARE